jgi:endoglucanase
LSGTPLGSLHVHLGPAGPDRFFLAAAMDEPALIIASIDDQGRARLKPLGAVEPSSLVGHRIRFTGGALGVIARAEAGDAREPSRLEDLAVDFGSAEREDVTASPAEIGLIETPLEEVGACLTGRSAAARGILAALVLAASRPNPSSVPATIAFLANSAIEDRGLGPSAAAVAPSRAILCRPAPAQAGSGPRLGEGPILGVTSSADTASRDLAAWVRTHARRAGIPLQERLLAADDRGLSTLQGQSDGVAAVAIELPAAGLHTPGEMIRLGDLLAMHDLLSLILRTKPRR